MLIDFSAIKEELELCPRGGEGEFLRKAVVTDEMKILYATLRPGASIGEHTHTDDCEVIYLLSGSGYSICDGVREDLKVGQSQYCPKGSTHNLVNTGNEDLLFFAVLPKQ